MSLQIVLNTQNQAIQKNTCQIFPPKKIPPPPPWESDQRYTMYVIKYLLLAEFLVRTVNYGPSIFPSIYGPSTKRVGHKSMKKKNEDP